MRIIRLARWFEWVFGTILLSTITVITSLQFQSNYGRWALLIGLLIFFVASLIKQFDEAGWFKKSRPKWWQRAFEATP